METEPSGFDASAALTRSLALVTPRVNTGGRVGRAVGDVWNSLNDGDGARGSVSGQGRGRCMGFPDRRCGARGSVNVLDV